MEELVVLVSDAGMIVSISTPACLALGAPPPYLIGRRITDMTHPADVAPLDAALARCAEGESMTLSLRLRDGGGGWLMMYSRLIGVTGEARRSVLVEMRSAGSGDVGAPHAQPSVDERIAQRLQAVGQLAAGVAHEINTPLQYVGDSLTFVSEAVEELLALTHLYREALYSDHPIPVEERRAVLSAAEERADVDYLAQRVPRALARTNEGIARVRAIVQAMKRFSHVPAVETTAPADLNQAIEAALLVSQTEHKYVCEIDLDLGDLPLVDCDIGELNQVFLNLIVNAAQAIAEDPDRNGQTGHIRISSRVDGEEAMIEIADDGPGIPAELKERIYEPFFTTKEVGKGTGQGLALVRAAVERRSGKIECHSTPGVGTRFVIRLPLSTAEYAGEVTS